MVKSGTRPDESGFRISFRISDRSAETIRRRSDGFTGAEVEGDLAVKCGPRWLGQLRDPGVPPQRRNWFDLAPIWNFVWDLASVSARLKHGETEDTVQVEGTPVGLRLRRDNGRVILDQILVAPPTQEGQRFITKFNEEFRNLTLSLDDLFHGTTAAIDQLLLELGRINPSILQTEMVHRMRQLRNSIAGSPS